MNKEGKIDLLRYIYSKLMEEDESFYMGNIVLLKSDMYFEKGIYIDNEYISYLLKLFKENGLMGEVIRYKPTLENLEKIYLKLGYKRKRIVLFKYPIIKLPEEQVINRINEIVKHMVDFSKYISRAVTQIEMEKLTKLEQSKKDMCEKIFGEIIGVYFPNIYKVSMLTLKEYKKYYNLLLSYNKNFFKIEHELTIQRQLRRGNL